VTNAAQAKSNPTGLVKGAFDIIGRLTKWKKCKDIWDLPADAFDGQVAPGSSSTVDESGVQALGAGGMQGGFPSTINVNVNIPGLTEAINRLADAIAGKYAAK
jgi:hypothetical protein